MKGNLFKKFLTFSYGSWIGLIIGFVTTLITTRILSPSDFGKSSMFLLTMNICMIFVIFGTDQTFVRFFYEEKEENRGGLLYNSLKISFLMALVISSLIILFNKSITLFLFNEQSFSLTIFLVIAILFNFLYRYGTLVIRMQQNGNHFSILELLNKLINLILVLVFVLLIGKTFEIIIYSTVITLIILTIISIFFERDFWNFKNFKVKNLKHSKIEIIKYSYPLVLTTVITWLFQAFDQIAIRHWSTFEELGLYAAAFKVVALLTVLQVTFSTFWTPVCYEHFEKTPDNKIFYQNATKIVSFIMFTVAILTIAGKDIIIYLLGSDFKQAANIMPFLVFMPMMYTISETTVIGVNFYKKPKWHILIAGVSCIVNIIGNWLLVPDYGAIGASISTAFSYIVFFSLRTVISLKYYHVYYDLKRIYFMILIIALYSIYSIINFNFYLNIIVGFCTLLFMTLIYYKDLMTFFKKSLIKQFFNRKNIK